MLPSLCFMYTHTHYPACSCYHLVSGFLSFSLWHMPLFSVQGLLVLTTANIVTVITTVSMSAVCTNGQIKVKLLLPPPLSKRCAFNGIKGSPPMNCKYFLKYGWRFFFHKVCHNYSRAKIRHTCFVLIKFQMLLLNSMGNIGKLGKKLYPSLPLAGLAKIRLFLEKSVDF